MRHTLLAFASGLLFGAGLLISRVADPAKVLNFLDFTGHWDPSMAFVLVGGVGVASIAFAIGRRLAHPWFGTSFPLLASSGLTPRLFIGAGLFGIGWGLVGLCPGPAVVALPLAPIRAGIFVIAMLVGLWGARAVTLRIGSARSQSLPTGAAPGVQNSR
ncbi:MAG: YeeE/YedE family protein [Acidiphilium sp.]|nr:YeeE/YedE family protein [Acidiphilium sp.]MDD4935808.1 YeeE/YedE family protein [Acidiphilium sp.]